MAHVTPIQLDVTSLKSMLKGHDTVTAIFRNRGSVYGQGLVSAQFFCVATHSMAHRRAIPFQAADHSRVVQRSSDQYIV
jgi:hypothetical protein